MSHRAAPSSVSARIMLMLVLGMAGCAEDPGTGIPLSEVYALATPQLFDPESSTDTSADLRWDPVSGATRYYLERSLAADGWNSRSPGYAGQWVSPPEDPTATPNGRWGNLIPGALYFYRVRAERWERGTSGSSDQLASYSRWSPVVAARAVDNTAPPALTDAVAMDVDGRSWHVTWSGGSAENTLEMRYSTVTTPGSWVQMTPLPTTLPPARAHAWTIRDVDLAGGTSMADIGSIAMRQVDAAGNASAQVVFVPEQRVLAREITGVETLANAPCFEDYNLSFQPVLAGNDRSDLFYIPEPTGGSCSANTTLVVGPSGFDELCTLPYWAFGQTRVVAVRLSSETGYAYQVQSTDPDSTVVELLTVAYPTPISLLECDPRQLRFARQGGGLIPSNSGIAFGYATAESVVVQAFVSGMPGDLPLDPLPRFARSLTDIAAEYFPSWSTVEVRSLYSHQGRASALLRLRRSGGSESNAYIGFLQNRTHAYVLDFQVAEIDWVRFDDARPYFYGWRGTGDQARSGLWTVAGSPPTDGSLPMRLYYWSLDAAFGLGTGGIDPPELRVLNAAGWFLALRRDQPAVLVEFLR